MPTAAAAAAQALVHELEEASAPVPIATAAPSDGLDSLTNPQLAHVLAFVLRQLFHVDEDVPPPLETDPAALFFSRTGQTGFTLAFYCERLLKFMGCAKACFVVAILYLARLAERWPVFALSELNVHRLVCTAVVLAAKWVEDEAYSNAHYARVAGVHTVEEMSRMEAHMLACLDFRLHVKEDFYKEVERNMMYIATNGLHLQKQAEPDKFRRCAT